jgi:hypothetical protein
MHAPLARSPRCARAQVAADMLLLATTIVVSVRYGLAADAFLDLVNKTADPQAADGSGVTSSSSSDATAKKGSGGGDLFGSTRAVASALAAAGALDAAMRTLQARAAAAPAPDTAASLASYFTLRDAERRSAASARTRWR